MEKVYSILLLLCPILHSVSFSFGPKEYVSVEQLEQAGKISVSIEGIGGYQQECVQLIVRNLAIDSIHGMVEAGRKLNSLNDGEQDILVVKNRKFSLGRGQADTIKVTGFCCESTKSSPGKNSLFGIGILAPAAWLILTNIIDKYNFPPSAIQHSIWALSNNHDIRSIPAFNNPETDQLRHTVANILDIELPWYSFAYAPDTADLFSGHKTHLFAEVPFTIPFQALISTEIFDKNGNLMYQAYAGSFRAGENTLRINVPIENWEVDDYDLFIMEDLHTTNKKLKLTLKEIQSQE